MSNASSKKGTDALATAFSEVLSAQPLASKSLPKRRRRLPKSNDRRADLVSAWIAADGSLGIEINDKGTVQHLLLRVAGDGLGELREAIQQLRARR